MSLQVPSLSFQSQLAVIKHINFFNHLMQLPVPRTLIVALIRAWSLHRMRMYTYRAIAVNIGSLVDLLNRSTYFHVSFVQALHNVTFARAITNSLYDVFHRSVCINTSYYSCAPGERLCQPCFVAKYSATHFLTAQNIAIYCIQMHKIIYFPQRELLLTANSNWCSTCRTSWLGLYILRRSLLHTCSCALEEHPYEACCSVCWEVESPLFPVEVHYFTGA